jgi:excisionase family DNA binding protein
VGRRVSAVRVKANRSYTVEEAAETVGVTPQTVRSWIRQGLPALTAQRPFLILGYALKDFLASAEASRKRPLRLGEFFCLRCKTSTTAAIGLAEYAPLSTAHGRLEAFCAVCEGPCSRLVTKASLTDWTGYYQIGGNVTTHA